MKILLVFILLLSFLAFTKTAEAKVLPQAKKAVKQATGIGIGVYPRFRSDRRAIIVNFSNLQNAIAVSYLLTYQTNTQDEGAQGALKLKGASNATQELLFGTCSKNVCRYHTGINNMRLEVSYTTKTGKKYLKRYKIRI